MFKWVILVRSKLHWTKRLDKKKNNQKDKISFSTFISILSFIFFYLSDILICLDNSSIEEGSVKSNSECPVILAVLKMLGTKNLHSIVWPAGTAKYCCQERETEKKAICRSERLSYVHTFIFNQINIFGLNCDRQMAKNINSVFFGPFFLLKYYKVVGVAKCSQLTQIIAHFRCHLYIHYVTI